MTKKHFQALALALYAAKPKGEGWHSDAEFIWRTCRDQVARACGSTNNRFDHERFCAWTEGYAEAVETRR